MASRADAVKLAIAIGKQADKDRGKKLTAAQQKMLRVQEVKNKINVLRGQTGDRYKRQRDQGDVPPAEEGEEEGVEETSAGGFQGAAPSSSQSDLDDEDEEGEGPREWSFKREVAPPKAAAKKNAAQVSGDARVVYATEITGARKATARQLMDAASEFRSAGELGECAELLELARSRVDIEQVQRAINLQTAQQLDDECAWQLADVYEQSGRLTLACDRYGELKGRMSDRTERATAEKKWAQISFAIAERLQVDRRFEESIVLLDMIKDQSKQSVTGDTLWEEVDLYKAMSLQALGRVEEAKEICRMVVRTTVSRKRRGQASFVLDVISIDTEGERNEEFHALWDENFRLPKDSYSSSGNMPNVRRSFTLSLTDSEREFRGWVTRYWEDRLKSPVYYAFLTLWVTWPFAIPVVAILDKAAP